MITGGGALPLGYATGGASALGLVNSTTGGLALTTDQMGSWMVTGQQNNVQMNIPQVLPGGEQRLSINNNQIQGGNGAQPSGFNSQAYTQAQSQANALGQLHTLQRLAALNAVSRVYSILTSGESA
jgi:hypothetical protein